MMKSLSAAIIEQHSQGNREGAYFQVSVDFILIHDPALALLLKELKKIGKSILHKDRVLVTVDHFSPPSSIERAHMVRQVLEFVNNEKLPHCLTYEGICHQALVEGPWIEPGMLVLGSDSHTTTAGALGCVATGMGSTDIAAAMATGDTWMVVPQSIKFNYHGSLKKWVGGKDLILHTIAEIGVDGASYAAMEFGGEVIDKLPLDGRFTMANMAIEAGGKAGLFHVDEKALQFVEARAKRAFTAFESDPDAVYEKTYDFHVSDLEPQVALPHSPANSRPVASTSF